jgi:hypothetical protein
LLQVFVAGFPVTLGFAWLFNFTPERIVRATADDAMAYLDKSESEHNNIGMGLMIAGEKAFYKGDYAQAINFYLQYKKMIKARKVSSIRWRMAGQLCIWPTLINSWMPQTTRTLSSKNLNNIHSEEKPLNQTILTII